MRKQNAMKLIVAMLSVAILAVGGCAKKSVDDKTVQVDTAKNFTNSIGMEMVCLNKGYYVSKYETTQGQYEAIVGVNPSVYKSSSCPVEHLTAAEAKVFCEKLTLEEEKNGKLPAGYKYALPTFAQWLEYVANPPVECSVTPYGGHPSWTRQNPLPVGSGETNRLGLFDIRGNIKELSQDIYSNNYGGHVVLGQGFNSSSEEKFDGPLDLRAGFMGAADASLDVGFRCVLVPK